MCLLTGGVPRDMEPEYLPSPTLSWDLGNYPLPALDMGHGYLLHPAEADCGQTDTCENITFPCGRKQYMKFLLFAFFHFSLAW